MKFKQICPECYFELVIKKLDDKVKKCPNCSGREISRQKIVEIDETTDIEDDGSYFLMKGKQEHIDNEIVPWDNLIEDDTLFTHGKCHIILKYVKGIIRYDFEIRINSEEGEALLGRSGLGKEYFQYDTRVSNEHIYVLYKSGIWIIKDDNSTNGTMINEKIIQPNVEYEVRTGDIVALGKSNNSVRLEVKINVGS